MEWSRVLEALLFAATEPLEPRRLATILREGPEGGQGFPEVKETEVREELAKLAEVLPARGLILREVEFTVGQKIEFLLDRVPIGEEVLFEDLFRTMSSRGDVS